METVNTELIAALLTGVITAAIVGVVAYLVSKNPLEALQRALEELGRQKAMLDAVETEYLKLPESTRALITAAVSKAVEIAEATETPLDDAFLDVLRKMTDGLPNARGEYAAK